VSVMHSDPGTTPRDPASFLPQTIFVASHRRSGTHLTIDSIRHNIADVNPAFFTLERILPTHHQPCSLASAMQSLESPRVTLVKTHALPDLAEFQCDPVIYALASGLLARAKIVYAIRDGRDVMVSFYEYRRKFDPALANVTFADFLRAPIDKGLPPARSWALSVESWLRQPEVCVVPYELYHADYTGVMRHIARSLGMRLNGNVFDMVMSRNPGAAKASSAVLFRRGGTEDYKAYFGAADYDLFEEEAGAAMAAYTQALEHLRSQLERAG
jgi:hypothetical protein